MTRRPISAAYLERKLRAILGLGGSNPVPGLEDLSGWITLESDRPEWRLPGGEKLVWQAASQAGVVGEFGYLGWRNPLSSGVIAVHEVTLARTGVAGGATGIVRAHFQRDPFDAADTVNQFIQSDFRATGIVGLSQGGTQFISGTQPVNGMGTQMQVSIAGGSNLVGKNDEHRVWYVIPPGTQFVWFAVAANTEIALSMHGYERPLEGLFELK